MRRRPRSMLRPGGHVCPLAPDGVDRVVVVGGTLTEQPLMNGGDWANKEPPPPAEHATSPRKRQPGSRWLPRRR